MSWLETEYEMRESPAAKMRTFLLKEIKGEMPGLKFSRVTAREVIYAIVLRMTWKQSGE